MTQFRQAPRSAETAAVDHTDHLFAAELAAGAGALLVALRDRIRDPARRRADGDRLSHEYLSRRIASSYPLDGLLSEEAPVADRRQRERVWIVDPLDGTREFAEGREDWAVHVSLVVDDRPVAGAVALPGLNMTFATDAVSAIERVPGPPRMVISRTRPPSEALAVAEALGAEIVCMGSAGAKAMAVVRGAADIYMHSGGQYEWDSAAPVAVALAAGLHASRLDGSDLRYNQPNPWLPDLLICRRELAEAVTRSNR